MGKLDGKCALITGGSSGIGLATAVCFAQEGAGVMITARSAEKGQAAVDVIRQSGEAAFTLCDVRESAQCAAAVEATTSTFGRLDILFNNAGIVPYDKTIIETTDELWLDIFATNVHGIFYMCRAALARMIAQGGGVIVNNASDWAVVGAQRALAYAATKGAVVQMTRSLALDHGRQGVRVNALCPGDTFVERWRKRWQGDSDGEVQAHLDILGASFPLGRVAQVEEIARAALFLASDDSSYMTGQLLIVDGGNTAGGASTSYAS